MVTEKQSIDELTQLLDNISEKLEKEDFGALKQFASELPLSELGECTDAFSLLVKLYDAGVISHDDIGWLRVAFHEVGHKSILELMHEYDMKRNIGPYKVMLVRVAKELEQAALEDLKGLSSLDRSTLDAVSTALEFFSALERRGDLSASNVRILVELLRQLDEKKLERIVTDYEDKYLHPVIDPHQREVATSQNQTPGALSLERNDQPSSALNFPTSAKQTQYNNDNEGPLPHASCLLPTYKLPEIDSMDPDRRHTQEQLVQHLYDPGQTFPKFLQFEGRASEVSIPYLDQSGHAAEDQRSGMKLADQKIYVDSPNMSSTLDEQINVISSEDEVKVEYSKVSSRESLKDGVTSCAEGCQDQACLSETMTTKRLLPTEGITATMEQLSLSNSQRLDDGDYESDSIDHQATAGTLDEVLTEESSEYTIHCMKCEFLLCNANYLRKRGTNVVVICPEYKDRVIVKMKAKPNMNTLYKHRVGYALCKNCQRQLGPKFVYKQGTPCDFGLSQGAVKWKLSTSDEYHLVEDWKAVPFYINKQKINETDVN